MSFRQWRWNEFYCTFSIENWSRERTVLRTFFGVLKCNSWPSRTLTSTQWFHGHNLQFLFFHIFCSYILSLCFLSTSWLMLFLSIHLLFTFSIWVKEYTKNCGGKILCSSQVFFFTSSRLYSWGYWDTSCFMFILTLNFLRCLPVNFSKRAHSGKQIEIGSIIHSVFVLHSLADLAGSIQCELQ